VYEKKIENRVTYLQKEEKKYVMKILATRSKASKIQDLKDERDRVMKSIHEGRQASDA
jgi:hypothetical protein